MESNRAFLLLEAIVHICPNCGMDIDEEGHTPQACAELWAWQDVRCTCSHERFWHSTPGPCHATRDLERKHHPEHNPKCSCKAFVERDS